MGDQSGGDKSTCLLVADIYSFFYFGVPFSRLLSTVDEYIFHEYIFYIGPPIFSMKYFEYIYLFTRLQVFDWEFFFFVQNNYSLIYG